MAGRSTISPRHILATDSLFNKSPIPMSFPSMSSLLRMTNLQTSRLKRVEQALRGRARANGARRLKPGRSACGDTAEEPLRRPAPARVAGPDRLSGADAHPLTPKWPPLPSSLSFLRDCVFRSNDTFRSDARLPPQRTIRHRSSLAAIRFPQGCGYHSLREAVVYCGTYVICRGLRRRTTGGGIPRADADL